MSFLMMMFFIGTETLVTQLAYVIFAMRVNFRCAFRALQHLRLGGLKV